MSPVVHARALNTRKRTKVEVAVLAYLNGGPNDGAEYNAIAARNQSLAWPCVVPPCQKRCCRALQT